MTSTHYTLSSSADVLEIIEKQKQMLVATEPQVWDLFFQEQKEFFQMPKLPSEISIIGTTPSWNDGDVCSHWQRCEIEYDYSSLSAEELELVENFRKALDKLEGFFNICYGTDWKLTLTKENGCWVKESLEEYYEE